eukprot:4573052-Heterocapsa_arctica.AAC.1
MPAAAVIVKDWDEVKSVLECHSLASAPVPPPAPPAAVREQSRRQGARPRTVFALEIFSGCARLSGGLREIGL